MKRFLIVGIGTVISSGLLMAGLLTIIFWSALKQNDLLIATAVLIPASVVSGLAETVGIWFNRFKFIQEPKTTKYRSVSARKQLKYQKFINRYQQHSAEIDDAIQRYKAD